LKHEGETKRGFKEKEVTPYSEELVRKGEVLGEGRQLKKK